MRPSAPRHRADHDPGLIVGAHGRHVVVEAPDGSRTLAHPRGKRNEAVVGDHVRWAVSGDQGVVESVDARRNVLLRQDEWRSKTFAANLDLMLVLLAVDPPWSESQLTRALVAAEHAGIRAVLVLNKVDLPGADEQRERLAPYRAMGTQVIELSIKHRPDEARTLLAPELEGRVTFVLGPSGMGKSTLINALVPGAAAQVGEISRALATGRHTTTTTTWYWMDAATRRTALIDSPGFQSFGVHQIDPARLPLLMADFVAVLREQPCRFANCSHLHEPGCSVRSAVDNGQISARRHQIYAELRAELESAPRHR